MIDATRHTYFAPYDDCQDALLTAIKGATKKIRVMDYSYNLAPLTDDLVAAHQNGLDVELVLDKSQSGGPTEKPQIERLQLAGVPFVIGTSDKHKIMHNKVAIIDDEIVISGSYNFTTTAALEDNFMDIETSPERATAFNQVYESIKSFMVNQEK